MQGSSCPGREEWSQGEQGLALPSWRVSSSGQTGLSSQAAQRCLQGHLQKIPFLAQSSPEPPSWEWGCPWQNWDPHACLPPPLFPQLAKARPRCHEPQEQPLVPPLPPCPGAPQCPGRGWAVAPGAWQSQATGDVTLWEGRTRSPSDMKSLWPPCSGLSPLGSPCVPQAAQTPRVTLCQPRAAFGQDPSSCPGKRFSPARRTGHRGPR